MQLKYLYLQKYSYMYAGLIAENKKNSVIRQGPVKR